MQVNTAGEQKMDRDALIEYKEKYRILTEIMPLGAFRLGPGPDYRVLSANLMLARMLGYDSPDSIIGISARDIVYNPAHLQEIENFLSKDGSVIRREMQLKQKEGAGIYVALNARIVPGTEIPVAWIDAVAEDVTERKIFEMEMHYHDSELNRYALALTQANKKLNLLSSITRHDILNQLTALAGLSRYDG